MDITMADMIENANVKPPVEARLKRLAQALHLTGPVTYAGSTFEGAEVDGMWGVTQCHWVKEGLPSADTVQVPARLKA